MKYLPLVLANLRRHRLRTVLTTFSVALALFLFASLRTVVTTLNAGSQVSSASRLIVQNSTAFVIPLPMSYANRLKAVPGVSDAAGERGLREHPAPQREEGGAHAGGRERAQDGLLGPRPRRLVGVLGVEGERDPRRLRHAPYRTMAPWG